MRQILKKILQGLGVLEIFKEIEEILNALKDVISKKKFLAQVINTYQFKKNLKNPKKHCTTTPTILNLVLTQRCNLKCEMCVTHSESISNDFTVPKDMTFEMFKGVVDKYHKAINANFIGNGEPMLHPKLYQMIDYAKSLRMNTLLITNGSILIAHKEYLVKCGLDTLYVSINSHDPKDYNRVAGETEEMYLKIVRNIKATTEYVKETKSNLLVGCSYIVDKQNVQFMQQMVDRTFEVGSSLCLLNNFLDSDTEGFTAAERTLYDTKEYYDIVDNIKIPTMPNGEKMMVLFPIPLKQEIKNHFCDSFFASLRVDGDGQIGGCSRKLLELEPNGNFRDKNHWNNDYFTKHRQDFIESNQEIEKDCLTCFSSHQCHPLIK